MNAPKDTQVGPECRPCSLTDVTVDLAAAVPIIIARPLAHAVTDGGMDRVAPPIALPLVRREPRAVRGQVLRDQGGAGPCVGMVTAPPALLARVARDEADDGRPVILIGPMPVALIRAAAGRIARVVRGRAVFPPRSGRARRPQRLSHSWWPWAPSHSGAPARGVAGCALACATSPVHAQDARLVPLSRGRGVGAPAWLVRGRVLAKAVWVRSVS